MALMKSAFEKIQEIILSILSIFPSPDKIDYKNLSDVVLEGSFVVVIAAASIHFLYILGQFWTTNLDVIDHFMYKRAIDINDIPTGTYRYLITIYTNWRPGSGTNAKVFIQLHGELGQNTICYFLHNPYVPYRELFGWSDVSWFTLNTSIPIGELRSIVIAHDNSGDFAAWHLSKVIVRDLQSNKSWRFFANCWFTEDNRYPEARTKHVLQPVDPDYVEPFGERMFEWARRLYRERPLTAWYNLNFITPLSRSQMLTITYCYLLTLMLLSIAYFQYEDKITNNLIKLASMTFRTGVCYFVLLSLKIILSLNVFTTRNPSQMHIYIRIAFAIFIHAICILMTFVIILYSTSKKFDSETSFKWLFKFMLGIAQSELMIAFGVTFFKAWLFTFFAKDPFAEEAARIQLTKRVTNSFPFTYKKDVYSSNLKERSGAAEK
ncbi:polycystic kidney disease protein 1-like 2 [Dinothrombium tinctorium]|uniref:Polycystic kidney disease protein 1-like 2 n=1 Tax=Dinothrombium tinctorium TaxID=1965070 RepID=A0A3S3NZ84_9ACAR|nr:polycystic kidney disease protein 1-like 2 [Dinothrombium tinctorium]RWS04737.1 polycystic kidney disease protein 1-like 2 [Dinothrombium tinctorium]RWS04860.1 polycystic kidney disease protein 1-like 2 [Dinothrombium tinctorium]